MTGPTNNRMPDFCSRRFPFHYVTAINMLMRRGIDPHRIDIIADGEYENYKGEIREQTPEPGVELNHKSKITLRVGYPSAVDQLPHQFFYGFGGASDRDGWDDYSRRLMAPFDGSLIRYDAIAHYQSLKHNFGVVDREQVLRFLRLFGFAPEGIEGWSSEELITWVSLMPSFHSWAGNPDLVARRLTFMFGYEFRIVENVISEHDIPDEIQYRLASRNGRLGRESIIGRRFVEYDSCYEIQVRGIASHDVPNWFPGKKQRKKLEWMLELCMPNHLLFHIRLHCLPENSHLGREKNNMYLGYAARI